MCGRRFCIPRANCVSACRRTHAVFAGKPALLVGKLLRCSAAVMLELAVGWYRLTGRRRTSKGETLRPDTNPGDAAAPGLTRPTHSACSPKRSLKFLSSRGTLPHFIGADSTNLTVSSPQSPQAPALNWPETCFTCLLTGTRQARAPQRTSNLSLMRF